jgi:hypothetical protein
MHAVLEKGGTLGLKIRMVWLKLAKKFEQVKCHFAVHLRNGRLILDLGLQHWTKNFDDAATKKVPSIIHDQGQIWILEGETLELHIC